MNRPACRLSRAAAALVLAAYAVLLAGCASDPVLPLATYLDAKSAITVRGMNEPYVFAFEASQYAANTRDYLDLRVLEYNEMGKRTYRLSLVSWSAVDRLVGRAAGVEGLDHVRLRADQEFLEFTRPAGEGDQGLSERMFERRTGQLAAAEFPMTLGQIQRLAKAKELSIDLGSEDDPVHYTVWTDAAATLQAFVAKLPAPRSH